MGDHIGHKESTYVSLEKNLYKFFRGHIKKTNVEKVSDAHTNVEKVSDAHTNVEKVSDVHTNEEPSYFKVGTYLNTCFHFSKIIHDWQNGLEIQQNIYIWFPITQ